MNAQERQKIREKTIRSCLIRHLASVILDIVTEYDPCKFILVRTGYDLRYAWYTPDCAVRDSRGVLQLKKLDWIEHRMPKNVDDFVYPGRIMNNACEMVRVGNIIYALSTLGRRLWKSPLKHGPVTDYDRQFAWTEVPLPEECEWIWSEYPKCIAIEHKIFFFVRKFPVQIYDTKLGTWSAQNTVVPTDAPTLVSNSCDKVYLIGGRTTRRYLDYSTNEILQYDIKNDTFATCGTMSAERCLPGSAFDSQGHLLVIGGYRRAAHDSELNPLMNYECCKLTSSMSSVVERVSEGDDIINWSKWRNYYNYHTRIRFHVVWDDDMDRFSGFVGMFFLTYSMNGTTSELMELDSQELPRSTHETSIQNVLV